ncbi:hypothetical protein FRB96_002543 [Tulasnella sp. 330]|nr:hypothetical protein FRB96_002543 [Tulasnella sp. 330]
MNVNREGYVRSIRLQTQLKRPLLDATEGHPQSEHETAHGSMENTAWAIEGGSDLFSDVSIEVQGRKFAATDGGAPQLCSSLEIANNIVGTPDGLLHEIVEITPAGGTNFDSALSRAQSAMETHWSEDRRAFWTSRSLGVDQLTCGV